MDSQVFIKATSKIKVLNAIEKLKQVSTFHAGHWSSAKYFDEDLHKRGIVSPIEIYHQYKMPNGYSEKEYEDYIMWLSELVFFEPDRILNIPKYVEKATYGSNMSVQEKQDYKNLLNKPLEDLNDLEKQDLVAILLKQKASVDYEIQNQINIIKKLNPELKDIIIPRGKELDFLIGVTSEFHQDDINYFLHIKEMNKEHAEQEKFRKTIGMKTYALFIEPSRRQKIINAVRMNIKSILDNQNLQNRP